MPPAFTTLYHYYRTEHLHQTFPFSKRQRLLLTRQTLRVEALLPGSLVCCPPPLVQTLPTSTTSTSKLAVGSPGAGVCTLLQVAPSPHQEVPPPLRPQSLLLQPTMPILWK